MESAPREQASQDDQAVNVNWRSGWWGPGATQKLSVAH